MTPLTAAVFAIVVSVPPVAPDGGLDAVDFNPAGYTTGDAVRHGDSSDSDSSPLYIWSLTAPAIPITEAQGVFARDVWLGCEVRTEVLTPYTDLGAVRNRQGSGAAGQVQLMPLHARRMGTMGLDFNDEGDRVQYGFWMLEHGGPQQWSCWSGR